VAVLEASTTVAVAVLEDLFMQPQYLILLMQLSLLVLVAR
jgi:hypothetical protein